MTTNKNPYEIRLELLKLAQTQAHEKWVNEWTNAAKKADIQENSQYLSEVPEYPSTEMVLQEAEKLKKFVDNIK